jgi:hypothetical protein
MAEHFSFALVLLVAVASVASLLFLSGTSATGNVILQGYAVGLPPYVACPGVQCPAHQPAYALQNPDGSLSMSDNGKPICICIPPQQE